MTVNIAGEPRCAKCDRGDRDTYRLIVRADAESRTRYLFHAHRNENLQHILLRLYEEFPNEWGKDVVYYFYIDMGGSFYPVEHAFWLRDRDQILVTTIEDESQLPDVSMNAVHASLRPHVQLQEHQQEGVEQMVRMEKAFRGGILGDDMGLGKTLQMISLIMRQQPKMTFRAPTLVLVPSRGLGEQWAEEIRTKTTYGSLLYFIYNEETLMLLEQPCFRVVITTYDRLRTEYRNREISGVSSPLIDTDWHRIILDESNMIRNMNSLVTKAVLHLRAKYRWCMTGTPLQNKLSELLPIFAFLEIPVEKQQRSDTHYLSGLLKQHMVRRTKQSVQTSLVILPRKENRVVLEFTDAERALYDYLERVLYVRIKGSRQVNGMNDHASAAALLYLRLKQACGHFRILLDKFPDLIPMIQCRDEEEVIETLEVEDEVERAARDDGETAEAFNVIESFYEQFGNNVQMPDLYALQKLPYMQHSTKVGWLIKFLRETLKDNKQEKVVVVTQFVDLLLAISDILRSINIRHNCYHGDMSEGSRTSSLREFSTRPEVRVILLSLKAGGVGLNLQRANHMVILDRWWNPATMDQAISRIHRMTQSKQTFIHTVVIKDTVEEGLMDNVLRKKSELFRSVVADEDSDGLDAGTRDHDIIMLNGD